MQARGYDRSVKNKGVYLLWNRFRLSFFSVWVCLTVFWVLCAAAAAGGVGCEQCALSFRVGKGHSAYNARSRRARRGRQAGKAGR